MRVILAPFKAIKWPIYKELKIINNINIKKERE